MRILLLCLILLLVDARQVLFKSGSIDTDNAPVYTRDFRDDSVQQFIVAFKTSYGATKTLAKYNIIPSFYVPRDSYVIATTPSMAEELRSTAAVAWIGHYDAKYKISTTRVLDIHHTTRIRDAEASTKQISVLLSTTIPVSEVQLHNIVQTAAPDAQVVMTMDERGVTRKAIIKFPASVDDAVVFQVMNAVAEAEFVEYVEPRTSFRPQNFFTKSITQIGQHDVPESQLPFYSRNIKGKGQVIGCGDTGIDVNNCFFYDPDHSVKYYTDVHDTAVQSLHRKIAGYVAFADDKDIYDGHGTMAAGTISGSGFRNEVAWSQFRGVAPESRIAFFDIGTEASGGSELLPDTMYDYFPLTYDLGARIHSNSWGASSNDYTLEAMEIDEYIYNHDDLLVLFPAGNEGMRGLNTVGTPGTAKNVLTIGASKSSWTAFNFTEEHKNVQDDFEMYQQMICQNQDFFSKDTAMCGMLNTTTPCRDAVINFCVIFVDSEICCNYKQLEECCPARDTEIDTDAIHYNEENLAQFSSIGPTSDGRTKPDVVVPGDTIWSAKSHMSQTPGLCNSDTDTRDSAITQASGTSIATAVAAGNIALLREYLAKGYINNGLQDTTYGLPYIPASLLKALVINSADPLNGNYKEYAYPGGPFRYLNLNDVPTPNIYEGYGRIKLDDSVPFMNNKPGYNVLIARNSKTPDTNIAHTTFNTTIKQPENSLAMCFKVTDSTYPVSVTMAYTDFPGNPTVIVQLQADLDLTVVRNGAIVHQGLNTADRLNNVETTKIAEPTNGDVFQVYISAMNVPAYPYHPSVSYSVVASGGIESTDCPALPFTCKHGHSANGVCVCDAGYNGVDCGSTQCPNDCSNKGECMHETGSCKCVMGFGGDDCMEEVACPNNCSYPNGVCHDSHCECEIGFFDRDCSENICTGYNLYTKANGVAISSVGHDATDRMECTMVFFPIAPYGYQFTKLMMNFTMFEFGEGTEVIVSRFDHESGNAELIAVYTGTLDPFTMLSPNNTVVITVEGFAPLLIHHGFRINYYGVDMEPVTPVVTAVTPDFGGLGQIQNVKVDGTWIISTSDSCSSVKCDDVNATVGGQTATLVGASSLGMYGNVEFDLPNITTVGFQDITVCSSHLNKCITKEKAYEVLPPLKLRRLEPSIIPMSGPSTVNLFVDADPRCQVLYVSFGNCFVRDVYYNYSKLYYTIKFENTSSCGAAGFHPLDVITNYCGSYLFTDALQIGSFGIAKVTPAVGPIIGNQLVNISGVNMNNGSKNDVISVKLAGVSVHSVDTVTPNYIIVRSAPSTPASSRVELVTLSHGTMSGPVYTYPTPGDITSVSPTACEIRGGCNICLRGENFYMPHETNTVVHVGENLAEITRIDEHALCFKAPRGSAVGYATIRVTSPTYGSTDEEGTFSYLSPGHITSFYPKAGPQIGGTKIIINGTYLCTYIYGDLDKICDVIKVSVCGIDAEVISSSPTCIVIRTTGKTQSETGLIEIVSASQHSIISADQFKYFATGAIDSVDPNHSPLKGGARVTIRAAIEFCDGVNDLQYVTLAGVNATIKSADSRTIVVETGISSKATTGDIVILSITHGMTSGVGIFTYTDPQRYNVLAIIFGVLGGIGLITASVIAIIKWRPKKKSLILLDDIGNENETGEEKYSAMATSVAI